MKTRKFVKAVGKIHLWLGLVSGLIVFIVAITGCLYAFEKEIRYLTEPYRHVEQKKAAFLKPEQLKAIAGEEIPEQTPHSVIYGQTDEAAQVVFYNTSGFYHILYINPYTGQLLKNKDMTRDFFRIVLQIHYYLLLPPDIGQPIVSYATLIFVIMLFTGIFLWYKKGSNKQQRFTIKWQIKWSRMNYDLHKVLGFYASWIAIILAITGMIFGLTWFKSTFYHALGGNKKLTYQEPHIRATDTLNNNKSAVNQVWRQVSKQNPDAASIEVHYPQSDDHTTIAVSVNPEKGTHWKTDYIYFDKHTLKQIQPDHIFGKFDHTTTTADKAIRLNYDIHTGAILGLPGKILAFFASLLTASLPVTGTYIWWGRRKKQKTDKHTSHRHKDIDKKHFKKPAKHIKSGTTKETACEEA